MIGWHSRNLHYVKKLPPLGEYLTPAPTGKDKREAGSRKALALFQGKLNEKDGERGV